MTTKNGRSKTPVTQGVEVSGSEARAWSSIEFRMKGQDYEGVTIAFGMSQSVENDRRAIKRLHRHQAEDLESLVGRKVTHLREIWEDL